MQSPPRSERRRARQSEQGSSTPELVVILPTLLLLIALGIQFALWALAAAVMSDSVDRGGAAIRAEAGTSATARAVVLAELGSLAGGLVLHPAVAVLKLGGGVESLSATGSVPSLIPGVQLRVSATSAGPQQRFRATG